MLKSKSLPTLKGYSTQVDELLMDRYKKAIEGDLTALRDNQKKGCETKDMMAMNAVEQSFVDHLGLSNQFSKLHELRNQLAKMQIEYIETDKRYLLNNIRQKQHQIANLENKMRGGLTIMQAKTILDKWLGVIIDLRKITVLDFYTKLKEYERNS